LGRFERIGPRIGVVALIALGAIFAVTAVHRGTLDPSAIRDAIAGNDLAPLIFVGLQIAASLLFVPRMFLGIAAGLLFGFAWGSFWAMLGAVAGAAAGFALWRWIGAGQNPLPRHLHKTIPIRPQGAAAIRDVRQGPDGLLYVVTGEDQGALLRIEPGEPVQ